MSLVETKEPTSEAEMRASVKALRAKFDSHREPVRDVLTPKVAPLDQLKAPSGIIVSPAKPAPVYPIEWEKPDTHPLRVWRKNNGVSLQSLAAKVGVSKITLSRVETGIQIPSYELAAKIIAQTRLELSPAHFLPQKERPGRIRIGPTLSIILTATAVHFDMTTAELLSTRRSTPLVRARFIFYFLCKQLTNHSFAEIAKVACGRDHSTILHGASQMAVLVAARNEDVLADIAAIKSSLGATP